jgi:DNA-binding CsgD family transcriptional regulator/GAF domain-containing protein
VGEVASEWQDLAGLGVSLVNARDIDDLGGIYIDGVAHLVDARAACYLVDPATDRPRPVSARGVGASYLQAYERYGRDRDPVHRAAVTRRRATADHLVMPAELWTKLPVFREVFRPEGLARLMLVPIVIHDRVHGTLNFGRESAAPPFDARDLTVAENLAGIVGVAIAGLRARLAAQRELAALWEPLERSQEPLVLFAPGLEARPNAVARRLMAGVREPAAVMGALGTAVQRAHGRRLAGTAPPQVSVTLAGGAAATLAGHPLTGGRGGTSIIVRLQVGTAGTLLDALPVLPAHLSAALTGREAEVAALAGQGLHDSEIARALHLSVYTVKQHLKAVYGKLGVRSRVELTRMLTSQDG